jgi:lipopolysaccharide biosynthesis glycosyltransferase
LINTDEDKSLLINNYIEVVQSKDEEYKNKIVNVIAIEYWIKENLTDKPIEFFSIVKNITRLNNPEKRMNNITKNFSYNNIPLNRNYLD